MSSESLTGTPRVSAIDAAGKRWDKHWLIKGNNSDDTVEQSLLNESRSRAENEAASARWS